MARIVQRFVICPGSGTGSSEMLERAGRRAWVRDAWPDLPFLAMRLEGIQTGDIVEVDRLGRRFHALVTESASRGLSIEPLDRRVSYRSCRAHEVRAHWVKRGRPRVAVEPREPSPDQLELDT